MSKLLNWLHADENRSIVRMSIITFIIWVIFFLVTQVSSLLMRFEAPTLGEIAFNALCATDVVLGYVTGRATSRAEWMGEYPIDSKNKWHAGFHYSYWSAHTKMSFFLPLALPLFILVLIAIINLLV